MLRISTDWNCATQRGCPSLPPSLSTTVSNAHKPSHQTPHPHAYTPASYPTQSRTFPPVCYAFAAGGGAVPGDAIVADDPRHPPPTLFLSPGPQLFCKNLLLLVGEREERVRSSLALSDMISSFFGGALTSIFPIPPPPRLVIHSVKRVCFRCYSEITAKRLLIISDRYVWAQEDVPISS